MEIPEEVARAEGVPEDLDSSVLGPYTVPDTRRRRRAGLVYVVGAGLVAAAVAAGLPAGMWVMAGFLVLVSGYHWLAAFHLAVTDRRAFAIADDRIPFPVGHASAAVSFDGPRARPVWNVVVFSADQPPSQRGLVRVDAVSEAVKDVLVEDNPEAATARPESG